MAAARCNNWEVVSLLCGKEALPEDTDSVIAILQTIARSEDLKKNYKMSHRVLDCLWNGLQQRKPDCQQTDTHSVLSQVGAKLNCWWLVRYLLSTELDLNLMDEDGLGVIHRLAMGHKDQHVSLLLKVLDKGADINSRNVVGDTAVHIAAQNRYWRMVEALLWKGARADIANNEKQTLLHILAVSLPANKELLENFKTIFTLLQKVPVNIDATDSEGNTALHLAVKEQKCLVAEKLMKFGARADVVDDHGRTVLHTVASQKLANYSASLLTILIESCADLNTRDCEGNTALQLAVMLNNEQTEKIFHLMVERGANINVRTQGGDSLLHLAAKNNSWFLAERLVKLGLTTYEPDSEGVSVVNRLAQDRTVKLRSVFRLLPRVDVCPAAIVHKSNIDSLLHLAAKHNNLAMVEYLAQKANLKTVNQLDSEGLNVFHRLLQYQPEYRDGHNVDSVLNILLSQGANTNIRTSSGDTALHLAAKHNKWNLIEQLSAKRCDVNEPDSEGFFIIHRLAQTSNESFKSPEAKMNKLFRFLLHKGTNLSVRCPAGNTALHLAAKHSNWNMVERLVEQGCDVHEADSEGFYIVHRLAQETCLHQKLFDRYFLSLLKKGTDLSVLTPTGDTALHLAARHNNWNLVERLIEQGCDINTPDSEGFYILHKFAQREALSLISNEASWKALLLNLLNKGASPVARSQGGDSVMLLAAKHGNWALVNHLLELGANINDLDTEGFSILHRLVSDRFISERTFPNEVLITKDADINCRCSKIGTPLHIALKYRKWDVAKRLAELGADVTECDYDGMSVLHTIAKQKLSTDQKECISLIQFFIEKGADVKARCSKGDSFLHVAAKHDNWEIVEQMISHTACNDEDVNEKDSDGFTILHRAASSETGDSSSLLHVLLNQGLKCDIQVNSTSQQMQWEDHLKEGNQNFTSLSGSSMTFLNIDTKDASGNTILHLCAKQRKWDQVHELLMSGADPGLTDDKGHTILYRLATEERLETTRAHSRSKVLQLLSRTILSTVETDEFGDTLIQIAARNRNLDFVSILFQLVDRVDVTDIEGLTLLHRLALCRSPESLDIVQRSLKKNTDMEVRCPKGNTALHLAAQCGNWDIVKELLIVGAKAGDTDSEGMSVLHRLVRRASSFWKFPTIPGQFTAEGRDPQIVKALFDQGVDVNTKDPNNLTPLQLAFIDREWEMVNALFECGADFERNDVRGKSLFQELAKDTSVAVKVTVSVTKHLLLRGLHVNERDSAGDTPLNLAAKHKNWRVVRAFAEVGADASMPDREGWFVCHRLAMDRGYFGGYRDTNVLDLLSLLTSRGFKVNQKGPDGRSSLQTALEHNNWEMVRWLIQLDASYVLSPDEKKTILENIRQVAGTFTDQDQMKSFIRHVIDKNALGSRKMKTEVALYAREAFEQLMSVSDWNLAKTLIECGLDINTVSYYRPLLHCVVSKYFWTSDRKGWLSLLDFLLARGVDINSRDDAGKTVLFGGGIWFSVGRGFTVNSLFRVLFDRGANPLLTGPGGISILAEALELEKDFAIAAVKCLIKLGVSTHQPRLTDAIRKCRSWKTSIRSPTKRAFQNNNVVAFKMLVKSGASSNKELFELDTRCQGQFVSKNSKSKKKLEMLDILHDAASKPYSLESLCRLTVSHALGCGPRRKEKVTTLEISAFLQDYILFCDVLSADHTVLERVLNTDDDWY